MVSTFTTGKERSIAVYIPIKFASFSREFSRSWKVQFNKKKLIQNKKIR